MRAATVLRLRTSIARHHLVREQALRVLREVFRCQPGDLRVLLIRDDDGWTADGWTADGWDDEDDDAWPPACR